MCAALNPFHPHWIQCVNSVEADISYKTNTDWLCFGKKVSTLETKRFVASNQHTNLHWVVWNVSTSKRSFRADKHGTRRVNKCTPADPNAFRCKKNRKFHLFHTSHRLMRFAIFLVSRVPFNIMGVFEFQQFRHFFAWRMFNGVDKRLKRSTRVRPW